MTSWPDAWLVEPHKVADSLLNIDHSDGAPKARALVQDGFSRSESERLTAALLAHVATASVREVHGPHGTLLVFEGALVASERRIEHLRSVWLLETGETSVRLVTACPYDGRRGTGSRTKP